MGSPSINDENGKVDKAPPSVPPHQPSNQGVDHDTPSSLDSDEHGSSDDFDRWVSELQRRQAQSIALVGSLRKELTTPSSQQDDAPRQTSSKTTSYHCHGDSSLSWYRAEAEAKNRHGGVHRKAKEEFINFHDKMERSSECLDVERRSSVAIRVFDTDILQEQNAEKECHAPLEEEHQNACFSPSSRNSGARTGTSGGESGDDSRLSPVSFSAMAGRGVGAAHIVTAAGQSVLKSAHALARTGTELSLVANSDIDRLLSDSRLGPLSNSDSERSLLEVVDEDASAIFSESPGAGRGGGIFSIENNPKLTASTKTEEQDKSKKDATTTEVSSILNAGFLLDAEVDENDEISEAPPGAVAVSKSLLLLPEVDYDFEDGEDSDPHDGEQHIKAREKDTAEMKTSLVSDVSSGCNTDKRTGTTSKLQADENNHHAHSVSNGLHGAAVLNPGPLLASAVSACGAAGQYATSVSPSVLNGGSVVLSRLSDLGRRFVAHRPNMPPKRNGSRGRASAVSRVVGVTSSNGGPRRSSGNNLRNAAIRVNKRRPAPHKSSSTGGGVASKSNCATHFVSLALSKGPIFIDVGRNREGCSAASSGDHGTSMSFSSIEAPEVIGEDHLQTKSVAARTTSAFALSVVADSFSASAPIAAPSLLPDKCVHGDLLANLRKKASQPVRLQQSRSSRQPVDSRASAVGEALRASAVLDFDWGDNSEKLSEPNAPRQENQSEEEEGPLATKDGDGQNVASSSTVLVDATAEDVVAENKVDGMGNVVAALSTSKSEQSCEDAPPVSCEKLIDPVSESENRNGSQRSAAATPNSAGQGFAEMLVPSKVNGDERNDVKLKWSFLTPEVGEDSSNFCRKLFSASAVRPTSDPLQAPDHAIASPLPGQAPTPGVRNKRYLAVVMSGRSRPMYSSRPTDRLRRRAQLSASWSFSNDCGDYSIFGSALSTSPRPTRPSFFKLGGCLANRVRRSGLLCGASTIASASIANNIKQNEDHSKTNRQDHERATRSPAIVGQDVQQQQCFVTASSSSCSYETTTGENEYEWQQSATSNKSASCAGRDNSVEQEHHVDVSFLSASALLELTPRSRARRLAFQHRAEKSGLLASDTRRTRLRRRGGALVRTSKRVRLNRASPSRYLLWTTAFLPGMQAEELKRHASCFERNLYQPERGDCIYLSQPSLLENSTSDMLKDPPTPQERPASFPSGETTNKNSLHVLAAYNSPSSKTKSAMLGNGKKEDGTGQTTTIIAFKDTRLRTPKKVFKISTIDDVLPASKEAPNELRHKCKTGSASSPKNVKARTSSTTRSNRRPLHGKAVAEVGSKKADKGNPHLAQKADAVLVVPTAPAVVNDEHKMALLADELVGYVKNREAPRNASSGLKQSNASQSKKQLLSSVSDFLLQRAARAEDMLYQLIFQVCAQLPELTDVPDIEGNHIAANGELTSGLHGEISSTRLNGFLTQLIDKLAHVQVLPEDRVCHLRELLYRHPSALSRPPSVAPLDLTENEADHHGDHMDGQLIVSAPGLFSVPNKANNDDALVHMEPGPELSTSLIVEENEADEKIGQSELTLTDALQVACGGTAVDEDVKARTMTTSPSSPPLAPINPINMATFMGTAEQVQVEQAPSTTFKNDNRVNSVGGVATHMKEMKDHHGGSDEDPSSILMQEDSVLPSLDEVDNYLASGSEEDGFSRNGRTPAEIADGGDGSADPLRTSKIALSPTNGTCTSKGNGRLRGENTEATSENVQEDVVLVNEEAQEKLVRRAQLQNQDEVLPSRSGTNAGLNQGNQDAGWLVPALAPQEPWMPRTVNTDELLQAEEEQNVEQAFIDQVEQIPVIDSEKASVDDVRTRTFSFRPCSTGRGSLIDVVAVPGDADSACKIADGVASNIFNTTEIAASAHVQSQPHNGELEDAFDEISLSRPRWPRDVATPHEMAQRTGSLSSAAATPTFAFRVDDRASQNTGELGGVTTAALLATIGKKLPDDVPPHAAGVNKDRVTTAALPVSTCFVGSSRDRSKFRTINATANPDAGKHNRATDDADGAEPQPLPEVETAAQRPQTQKKEATKDPMTPTCNVKDVVQTSVATPDDKEPRMVTPNLSSIQRYSTPGCGAVALSSSNGTSVSQGTLGAVSGSQRRIGHRDGMLDQHAEMAARFSVLAAQQLQEENSSTRAAGAEQEVTVRTTTNMGVLPTATTMPTHVHVEVDQHRLSSLPARAMHLMGEPRRHEQEQEEEDIKLDYLEAVRKSEEREEQFAMQLDENRKVPTRPTARTTASGSITTSCGRTTAGSLCSPLEIRHTELITNIRVPEARGRETTQFVAPAFPATNDLSEKVMPATKMEDVGKVDSGEKTEDLQNVYGQDFGADHVFVGRESVARPSQSIVLPKKAEGRCAFFSFDSAHDHPTAPAVGSSSTTQKNGDFGMDDVPAYEAVVRTIANAELRRFFGGDSGSDVEHAVQVCKATATSPLQKVNAVGAIGDENQNMESQSADVCAPGGFVHSTTTSQAFFRSSIPGRVTRHTVAARTRFLEPPRAVADQTRSSVTPSPSLRAHDKSPQTRDRTPQFLLSPRGFNKICEQSMSPSRNGRALMAPASTAVRPSGSRVGVCKSGASRVDKSVTSRNAFAYSPRPRPNLFHEHHITIPEKHFFETKPAPLPLVDAASQAADPLLRSAPQTKTNVTRAPGGALNQLRSPRGASSIYASNLYEHQHQTNSTSLGRNQGSRAAPFRLLSPRSPSVYQNQREKRPYANQQADITLLPASEAGTSYENETDEIRLLIRRAAAACAANVGAADQMDIAKPVEAAALTSDIRTAKMRRYAGIENDHQDVPTRSSTLAQNQQARIPRACRSFFPPFQREVNRRVAAAQYTGEVSCGNDSGDVTTMPLLPHPVIARYPTSPEKYFDYQQKMSSQENVEDREPCQSHSVHPKREHDQQHTQHPYTTSVPVRLCAAAAPPPSEGGVEMTNTASVVRKAPRIWPLPPAHTDSLIGWAADFRSRSLSRPKPLLGQQQETVGVRDSSGFPRASCSTATQRLLPAEAPMICEKTRYGSAPIGGGNYRPSTARASQPPVGSISLENKFKPAPLRAKIKPVDLMAGVPFTLDLSQPQNLLSSCFLGLPDAGANVVEDSRSPHQEDGDAPGGALIAEVDSGAAAFATEQRAPHLDDSLTEVEVLRSPGCWKPDPEVEAAKSSSQIISDKGEPEPMEYNLLDHRISFADDVVEERDKVQQAREPLSGTPAPGLEGNIIASSSSSSSRGSIYACGEEDDPAA